MQIEDLAKPYCPSNTTGYSCELDSDDCDGTVLSDHRCDTVFDEDEDDSADAVDTGVCCWSGSSAWRLRPSCW